MVYGEDLQFIRVGLYDMDYLLFVDFDYVVVVVVEVVVGQVDVQYVVLLEVWGVEVVLYQYLGLVCGVREDWYRVGDNFDCGW